MLYLSENLKKHRILKNYTQEDVGKYLNVTPQSVSKWERNESYPDITLLPAIANLFETSIDRLLGMDTIRQRETIHNIHKSASEFQQKGDYEQAEKIYRNALFTYPNKPEMVLALAGVLSLQNKTDEAIDFMERGLSLSENEKQKATSRAVLCFLYLKSGKKDKAATLASQLPHTRESREAIQPLILAGVADNEINTKIKTLLLGD